MRKLTAKQSGYVQARLAGRSKTESAIAAGYSPRGAAQAASGLEKHPDIKKAIRDGRKSAGVPVEDAAEEKRLKDKYATPLDLLLDVVNNPRFSDSMRYQAAKDSLPYTNARIGETGKKETKQKAAEKVASKGRFKPKGPPQLRMVK